MSSLQNQHHRNEEKAIFKALSEQPKEQYREDADAIFQMHLDVPDAIMKKLRSF